jgi:peptide/nickel transport system permease protein
MEYPLGTDKLGRDVLTRIMYGARVSLLVAVASIGAAGIVGVLLGMVAGFRRGWTETIVMRLVDVNLSLPTILLALLFAVASGPSLRNLLIVISLSLWSYYARQAHAETLSLREREFVAAARSIGATDARLVIRYILPNLFNTMVILATLQISTVVLMEAALSFLGIGIPPPTPSWGLMISDGRNMLQTAWWVSTIPGIALAAIIVSANLLGDWLRDYLDPTLRRSK